MDQPVRTTARSASAGHIMWGHVGRAVSQAKLFTIFNGSLDFAAGFPGLNRLPAVIQLLALCQPEFDLGVTALGEVNTERDEREAFLFCATAACVLVSDHGS